MLLPIRSKNPPETFPVATCILILANTLIFFLTTSGGSIVEDVVSDWGVNAKATTFITFFTYQFLHGDFMHLFGNMLFLYIFGFAVEGRLKWYKFLPLYLLTGVGGGLLHCGIASGFQGEQFMIGASGSIMGVLGMAMYMFPYAPVTFFYFVFFRFGFFDMAMYGVALLYLALDLIQGFLFASIKLSGGVAHFAHIGGLLSGVFLIFLLRPKRDSEFASQAKATLHQTKDLGTLSRMELEELHRLQPEDGTVMMHLMNKAMGDYGGPKPIHILEFKRLLPKLILEPNLAPVASIVANLATHPKVIDPAILVEIASRLKKSQDYSLALRLYESAQRDPQSTPSIQESSTMRIAVLSETVFQQFDRAYSNYESVVKYFPNSPMADQAKNRMRLLAARMPNGPTFQ